MVLDPHWLWQVVSVLKKDLEMDNDDLSYVRGETFQFIIVLSKMHMLFVIIFFYFNPAVHSDGQYQAETFQTELLKYIESDPFFLLPWDVAHWIDRVMEKIREKDEATSVFFKRIIKRSNKLHTMFCHGRGQQNTLVLRGN